MMIRAIDCAAYLVAYSIDFNKLISNLQLQKMLFFSQVDYMTSHDGRKLFPEDMYAWQYGPVIPLVYNAYSRYGGSPIRQVSRPNEDAAFDPKSFKRDSDAQDPDICAVLEEVYTKWVDCPAWSLVAESHEKGKTWDVVYNRDGVAGSGYGEVIDSDTIMATYGRK